MCVIAPMSLATADMTKACMNDYETSASWICGPKVYCHFEIQVALLIYPYENAQTNTNIYTIPQSKKRSHALYFEFVI